MAQKYSTVAVAVINRNKKILLLKRGPTAPYNPLKYCLPGGTVEPNETLEEAASRELSEETGINYHKDHLERLHVVYPSGYSKFIFVAEIDDAEVRLNYEHTEYVWIHTSELKFYPIVRGLNTILGNLKEIGLIM